MSSRFVVVACRHVGLVVAQRCCAGVVVVACRHRKRVVTELMGADDVVCGEDGVAATSKVSISKQILANRLVHN